MDGAVGQGIEGGQGGLNEKDGENAGYCSREHGFGQELEDQVAALGTDGFSDADFAGAALGAGGGEVHKIDAGDDQHEEADDAEHANIVDEAADRSAILKV